MGVKELTPLSREQLLLPMVVIVTTIIKVTTMAIKVIPTIFYQDRTSIPCVTETVVWPWLNDIDMFPMSPRMTIWRRHVAVFELMFLVFMIVLGRNALCCANSKECCHEHSNQLFHNIKF